MANKVRMTYTQTLQRLKRAIRDRHISEIIWEQLNLYFCHLERNDDILNDLKIQDITRLITAMKEMQDIHDAKAATDTEDKFVARLREIKTGNEK